MTGVPPASFSSFRVSGTDEAVGADGVVLAHHAQADRVGLLAPLLDQARSLPGIAFGSDPGDLEALPQEPGLEFAIEFARTQADAGH